MREKRVTNSKWRKTIFTIVTLVIFIALVVKYINPLLVNFVSHVKAGKSDNNTIIKPYVENNDISDVEKKLLDNDFLIDNIKIASNSSEIIISLKNGPVLIYSRNKDISWQINSSKLIISRLTIENKKPAKIDFRYEKPIVIF